MDEAARVLAECAAAPDDDAPRLVWADLVGGERGELVVLQCDLARGGLSPAEARARRARERELLERHAVAWAGELARIATRWSFRRGFIEAARLPTLTALDAWPLLRSVTVDHWIDGKHTGLAQLRALGITHLPAEGDELPVLPHLRALSLEGLADRHATNVIDVIANASIETLRIRRPYLLQNRIARVLDAAPRLVALELVESFGEDTEAEVAAAARRPLRSFRLGMVRMRELACLHRSVASATLEHLAFDLDGHAPGLADLVATLPRLRSVELGGNIAAAVTAFGNARIPLRALRLHGEVSPALHRDIAAWFELEQLDLPTMRDELLHEAPEVMGTLGAPWFEWSQPAVLARMDVPEIFDVPAVPADERILLGRGRDLQIRLMSGTVARRHAALVWRHGVHEIHDLGGTNGIVIAGARIERTALHDGDEIVLGAVTLRYFIGPAARDRAVAAISGSSTR